MATTTTPFDIKNLFEDTETPKDELIQKMSETSYSKEEISDALKNTDFTTDESKEVMEFILEGCVKNATGLDYYDNIRENFTSIIVEACLQKKIDSIISIINESRILSNIDDANKLNNATEAFIKLYENINSKSSRLKLLPEIDKKIIVQYVHWTSDNELTSISYLREILEFNQSAINDAFIGALKAQSSSDATKEVVEKEKEEKEIKAFKEKIFCKLLKIGKGLPSINTIFNSLPDSNLSTIINGLEETKLIEAISNMPSDLLNRVIKLNKEKVTETFQNMSQHKKEELLGKIQSPDILKQFMEKMTTEEREAINTGDGTLSSDVVKEIMDDMRNEANEVNNDYNELFKNKWSNRFSRVSELGKKISVSILKMRIGWREDFLTNLASMHTSNDCLGLISRVQFALYIRSSKKYQQLNKDLEAEQKSIEKIKSTRAKKEEKNKELREDIKNRKMNISAKSQEVIVRRKKIENIQGIQRLIKSTETTKKSNLGDFKIKNDLLEMAWAYVLEGSAAISEIDETKIKEIITNNNYHLGNLTEDQLNSLAKKMTLQIEKLKEIYKDPEELEEATGKLMGRGMSNFALIIAITTLTITGLIILLTMILS